MFIGRKCCYLNAVYPFYATATPLHLVAFLKHNYYLYILCFFVCLFIYLFVL